MLNDQTVALDKKIEAVALYLKRKSPNPAVDWSLPEMKQYVAFHMSRRTINVCLDGDGVCGVVIAYRQRGQEMRRWEWQESDEAGDTWWWAQLAADSPEIAIALVVDFGISHPGSLIMQGGAKRNGVFRQYKPGGLLRELGKALRIYGLRTSGTSSN